jgi:WD40 repeat protein
MITLRLAPGGLAAGHEGEVTCCEYTPDGQFLLSGGWDGHLRLWETSSGGQLSSLRVGPKAISACAVAPDAKAWWAGSMEGTLGAWDAVTHQAKFSALAHIRPISAIRFSPDGDQVATASWDRQVALRPVADEGPTRVLSGHADIVAGCRFLPDGKQVVSWSHDTTLRLWDVEFLRCVHTFQGHTDRIVAAAVSPDGRWVLSAARNGVVQLWDVEQRCAAAAVRLGEPRGCFFLPDGETAVVVDAAGWLLAFTTPGMDVQAELGSGTRTQAADLAPSGDQLALGGDDGRVSFVDVLGLDEAPLVVNPTQALKEKHSVLGRFFGKTRVQPTYQYSCPLCQHTVECEALPERPFSCRNCGRSLRLGRVRVLQSL